MVGSNPNDLLTTLSQSSAVMVAIIGGFLVSRLVALSTEREAVRRQLREARESLELARAEYEPAHRLRVEWSQDYFDDLALETLVEDPDTDLDVLIAENVPKGSSEEEIRPYAERLQRQVKTAYAEITGLLRVSDDKSLALDDLKGRGLQIPRSEVDIYESVFYEVVTELRSHSLYDSIVMPPLVSSGSREIEARRFDDAVRDEAELSVQMRARELEIQRLTAELRRFGRPTGVVSATWMLAVLSVTGILLPVIVMATDPTALALWAKVALITLFAIGLASVIAYVVWYLKLVSNDAD